MKIVLPRPDDWHVHLRQGPDMVAGYAAAHAAAFGRVLAMPNTDPPLTSPEAVFAYRRDAEAAAPGLSVLPAFRLMPGMGAGEIRALADAGVLAGKYYPDGATTNSDHGLTHWRQAELALAAMEKHDIVLCVHGEEPDAPVLDREAAFLPVFREMRRHFPRLRMVLEHVSTAEGVRMVLDDPGPTAATVTVQHLNFTLDNLLGGMLNPHLFCKPVVKTHRDRESIREVVFSGHHRFFFGSDSAPHLQNRKESDSCPAGAYTAPMILPALATIFEEAGCLDRLKTFICLNGRNFYRMPPNAGEVVLVREPWTVPVVSEGCVPLLAGQTLPWRVGDF